jgi:hypothetical protein
MLLPLSAQIRWRRMSLNLLTFLLIGPTIFDLTYNLAPSPATIHNPEPYQTF